MAEKIRPIDDNDLSKSWVTSSRFIFYTSIFCLLAFVFSCSFRLWQQRWKGNPKVNVPESTLYNPTYKK
jgi:hypothetical protein